MRGTPLTIKMQFNYGKVKLCADKYIGLNVKKQNKKTVMSRISRTAIIQWISTDLWNER